MDTTLQNQQHNLGTVTEIPSLLLASAPQLNGQQVRLSGSKSASNRALLLMALAGGDVSQIINLANAKDTEQMLALLEAEGPVWDVGEAGTACRFMTAYLAITDKRGVITGSARMHQRPIGVLVEALQALGADVSYTEREGYLPLRLNGFVPVTNAELALEASVSSQYISALLMVGPLLPGGLTLFLQGDITSRPYLELTIQAMQHFGVEATWLDDQTIRVEQGGYVPVPYVVEPDWSSAGYWYSMLAQTSAGSLFLPHLGIPSTQADYVVAHVMRHLGVRTATSEAGIYISRIPGWTPLPEPVPVDCTHCPDLAQTLAVAFALQQQPLILTGLHTLRIKETDRILALQQELPKIGASMEEVMPGTFLITGNGYSSVKPATIHTYNDHRMALAFAAAAVHGPIRIEEPEVVVKSYPEFWQHLVSLGASIQW